MNERTARCQRRIELWRRQPPASPEPVAVNPASASDTLEFIQNNPQAGNLHMGLLNCNLRLYRKDQEHPDLSLGLEFLGQNQVRYTIYAKLPGPGPTHGPQPARKGGPAFEFFDWHNGVTSAAGLRPADQIKDLAAQYRLTRLLEPA